MKKAVAYGRFSTDMQREESIDAQFRAIREYCQRNKIDLINTYADEGISGTTDNRPQFQKMIKDAELGVFDYVIVHKLDRFSRSKYDSAIYKRKLKLAGVQLLSVLENLDGSPESIILESVLEGMSEYYSRNLSREVKKGLKENALRCQFNGGTPPLGYDIDRDKNYIINQYEAEIVRLIYSLYTHNYSYEQMSKELNKLGYKTKLGKNFTRSSFYEILTNEKYIGTYVYSQNGLKRDRNEDIIRIENGIPAIIDKSTWNISQEMLEKRRKPMENVSGYYYKLTGLICCGECGAPMSGLRRKNWRGEYYYYYRCGKAHKKRDCHAKSIRADKIEKLVLNCFNKIIFTEYNKELIIKSMIAYLNSDTDTERITGLTKELETINNQIDNIVDAVMAGIKSESLKERLKNLEDKKQRTLICISKTTKPKVDTSELENKLNQFLKQYNDISKFTPREQSLILRTFVDKIICLNGKVTLKLKMVNCGGNAGNSFPHHIFIRLFRIFFCPFFLLYILT